MDLFLMILKYTVLSLVVIPFVLIKQHSMIKEEKQLRWKGILIAWVIAIALLTIREYYDL